MFKLNSFKAIPPHPRSPQREKHIKNVKKKHRQTVVTLTNSIKLCMCACLNVFVYLYVCACVCKCIKCVPFLISV